MADGDDDALETLGDMEDFLKEEAELMEDIDNLESTMAAAAGDGQRWQRGAGLAGDSDDLFGGDDRQAFAKAAGTTTGSLADLTTDELREENKNLREGVGELIARLRLRDQQLAAANAKLGYAGSALRTAVGVAEDGGAADDLERRSSGSFKRGSAKDLLLSHLADAGFSASNVENVLDNITTHEDGGGVNGTNGANGGGAGAAGVAGAAGDDDATDATRMMNEVLDRLLSNDSPDLDSFGSNSNRRSSNPSDLPSDAVDSLLPDPPTPGSAQQPLGLAGGLEHSGFIGGNVPRNNRHAPRTNLEQFGLFAEAPLAPDGAGESPSSSSSSSSLSSTSSSSSSSSSASSSSSSSSNLFRGVKDVAADPDPGSVDPRAAARAREGEAIPYEAFLGRLLRPENADLVMHVKLYVSSVLGPNGDGSPPTKAQAGKLEYRFYGTHMLKERCADFFQAMEKALSTHVAWQNIGEAGITSCRNNLEKYVMAKIADLAIQGELDENQDRLLWRRMEVLDFITPEALDVNPNLRNEVVWPIAQDELRKLAHFKAPGDKIECVVNCCQVIFSVLNLTRGSDDTSRPGADDFLPIFIYVVLKAKVPSLYTHCEFIQNYLNPAALMSKAGYCFVNLRSAVEFILTLDASVINMDAAEFEKKLAENERRYDLAHPDEPPPVPKPRDD